LHPLKNILNKVIWDRRENPEDYIITFVHRGAVEDLKTIPFAKIQDVGNSWFTYQDDAENETTIPFHRVTCVKNTRSAEVIWQKRVVRAQADHETSF